jgi:hypothetical protein
VERKTTVKFGGAIGGVLNRLGGKATKEGVVETTTVKGSRRASLSANAGEIVDLGEEKIYQLDLADKSYRVVTFAELRRQAEEASQSAGSDDDGGRDTSTREERRQPEAQKEKPPEYEVDFDVNETGARENINGFDTRQVVWTLTVRPKGKTLEEGGGVVLLADMWMGPRIAAVKEVEDFEVRYGQKLYGTTVSAADMRSMAAVMAANPAMGTAMKKLQEKRVNADGTAIRATLTFDAVGVPGQQGAESGEDRPNPAKALGGLMGRLKKKKDDEPPAGAGGAAKNPNRKTVFTSTTEIVKAAGTASPSEVAIPAGFKPKG